MARNNYHHVLAVVLAALVALAAAQALSGDLATAHNNLSRAIELEPRNRSLARQDADFAPLANQAPFHSLLYPEKKAW